MSEESNFFDSSNYRYFSIGQYEHYWNTVNPLVSVRQIEALNRDLLEKRSFFITAGDCAELFSETLVSRINRLLQLLNDIKLKFANTDQIDKVLLCARAAGQYAKSRSHPNEGEVLNYFGDAINEVDKRHRKPRIFRLYKAFLHSKLIGDILKESCCDTALYTSHEALILQYEYLFCKRYSNRIYYLGSHVPWIGVRTRNSYVNHIRFLGKISNPVAVKIDIATSLEELNSIATYLYRPERATLFVLRIGVDNIEQYLTTLLKEVDLRAKNVFLICDPMHGNTVKLDRRKVRKFEDIEQECKIFFKTICSAKYSGSTGLHIETSASPRQECNNGAQKVESSICDPRLTYSESLRLTDLIIAHLL